MELTEKAMESEESVQIKCITAGRKMLHEYGVAGALLYHCPIGHRDGQERARMLDMGMHPGKEDLYLDLPRGPYSALRIELKRPAPFGRFTEEQLKSQLYSQAAGICSLAVCSVERFIEVLASYLSLPPKVVRPHNMPLVKEFIDDYFTSIEAAKRGERGTQRPTAYAQDLISFCGSMSTPLDWTRLYNALDLETAKKTTKMALAKHFVLRGTAVYGAEYHLDQLSDWIEQLVQSDKLPEHCCTSTITSGGYVYHGVRFLTDVDEEELFKLDTSISWRHNDIEMHVADSARTRDYAGRPRKETPP